MKSSVLLLMSVILGICANLYAEEDMTNRPSFIEKTAVLDGMPCVLRGAVNKDTGKLEILKLDPKERRAADETAQKVAEVVWDNVAPYDFNFEMSSDEKILWVFFKDIDPLDRTKTSRICALVRKERGDIFTYVTSFNLSEMLRGLAMKKLRSGNPLPLSRGSRISVLSIQCTNSTEATISGKWGEQCAFNVHLCLGSTGLSPKEWDIQVIRPEAEVPK